jgi:hypothetical protein
VIGGPRVEAREHLPPAPLEAGLTIARLVKDLGGVDSQLGVVGESGQQLRLRSCGRRVRGNNRRAERDYERGSVGSPPTALRGAAVRESGEVRMTAL